MQSARSRCVLAALILAALSAFAAQAHAQAALLMEQPYGLFGRLNPTGHTAIYFARICAETPTQLRRCMPGETGSVLARYQGIAGYDWIAIPLLPYLYSTDDPLDVPLRVNRETVQRLRDRYYEQHLLALGDKDAGNFVHGGWTQLVGAAYERRIYAYRFPTTPAQDDALIAALNGAPNRTRFNLLYSNCADFARGILNSYFPKTFRRALLPDAAITTPRQITYRLLHFAHSHPDTGLQVFEIPQVPGYRKPSHDNKSVAASLMTTGYAVPLVLMNPYLAGGLFVDYLARGRYPLLPRHPELLGPDRMAALTDDETGADNAGALRVQSNTAIRGSAPDPRPVMGNPVLKEIATPDE